MHTSIIYSYINNAYYIYIYTYVNQILYWSLCTFVILSEQSTDFWSDFCPIILAVCEVDTFGEPKKISLPVAPAIALAALQI